MSIPRMAPYDRFVYSQFLYFAQRPEGGLIKIGFSSNVTARLSGLRCRHKCNLALLASCKAPFGAETGIHLMLSEHRIIGEWFNPCDLLDEVIRKVLSGNTKWLWKFRNRRRTKMAAFVQKLLADLNWSYLDLAAWMNCSPGSVWNWIVGYVNPYSYRIYALEQLRKRLDSGEQCDSWKTVPPLFWLDAESQRLRKKYEVRIFPRNVVDMC